MIGTFKKLSYERKLGWYFSLLTSLVDKYFQVRVSNKVNWRCHLKGVFFLKGTLTGGCGNPYKWSTFCSQVTCMLRTVLLQTLRAMTLYKIYLDCDEGTLIIFNQGTKESDKESSVSRDEPWRPGLSTALEGSEFIWID